MIGLGQIERDLGNKDVALRYYREAESIYRSLGDPLKLAHTVRHVGDILRSIGSVEQARVCYEEALAIYRGQNSTSDLDLANTVRGFALLKEGAGELPGAKILWQEARILYKAADVQPGVQESDSHLELLTRK